jgi:hypothetical protein
MRLNEHASDSWIWKAVGCAAVAIGGIYLLSYILGGLLTPLKSIGQSVACQSNIYPVTRAFRLYADDYEDRFPPAENWMDRTAFYTGDERRFHCPAVSKPGETRFGYGMNSKMGGVVRDKLVNPDQIPLIFDSTNLKRSAHDPFLSFPKPGRHITRPRKDNPSRRGNFVGYAGGNARIRLDPRSR